jgi:nicotinate phosphoribosyltransferase
MSALNTDLYQLTMGAGYFVAGKAGEIATFELSVRRLPDRRSFLLAAGLQQAVEYLLSLQFTREETEYLRSLPQFRNVPPEFFNFLEKLRFTGDLFALPEGTPVFAGEPIVVVRAPIVESQLVETTLLSTIGFQTLIASKAARCVLASAGRPIVEFGSRRAHSPAAGVLAARAAFIGGCTGTSNTEAGMRFAIPVFGTSAHSWTMAFETEEESFRALQRLLGDSAVFLLDTYDTLNAARLAANLGKPMWGVRLDSGDVIALARQVRKILDHAGLKDAKIFATGDLDENRISEFIGRDAPIDAYGVGTKLSTSADAPYLSAVYKLVEFTSDHTLHYTAKFSTQKATLPGAKQIYRRADSDTVALYSECNPEFGEPLLRPVIMAGKLLEPLPSLEASQNHARKALADLPPGLRRVDAAASYQVQFSPRLLDLAARIRQERHPVPLRD